MKLELDIKEVNLLVKILSSIDPAGIFCNNLKNKIEVQIEKENNIENQKDFQKTERVEQPVIFGVK